LVAVAAALAVLLADLGLALGTADSHVEMIIVGAGVRRLLQQHRSLADVALVAPVVASEIERALSERRGDEDVAQAGSVVVDPALDQQPVAVGVELEATAVLRLAVAVEGHHALGVDGPVLRIQLVERDVGVAATLVARVPREVTTILCGN